METLTKISDIVKDFAIGSQTKDHDLLENLLHQDGEFETENENDPLDRPQVGKQAYLTWYMRKLETTAITSIQYDQCLHCVIGNPVILFNDGEFPRREMDGSARSKTGLMFTLKDEKIIEIKFCFVFLKSDNKYLFEVNGEKIKQYIAQGVPVNEAIEKVIGSKP